MSIQEPGTLYLHIADLASEVYSGCHARCYPLPNGKVRIVMERSNPRRVVEIDIGQDEILDMSDDQIKAVLRAP